MDMNTRLTVFRELIDCAFHLPLWRCDEDFTPLDSQQNSWLLGKLFLARRQADTVRAFAEKHNKPLFKRWETTYAHFFYYSIIFDIISSLNLL